MTSAASRHVSSYQYYSPLCLVLGPMQPSFEDFKLYTPELNSPKDLIRESRTTSNRCTYTVPLFDQLSKKALSDFVPEYLVPELSTRQIRHRQRKSRSSSTYSLAKHSRAADEDWYLRYHPAWTRKAQGGVHYDSTHYPEDSIEPCRAPQGVDNYIYKNICKIDK
jgi:hypothetical protein